jgi:prolyl oligopeptidase
VYNGAHAAFVHSGGALVLPCLRGGGEFGERWWQGGRMAGKRQTFDDLFAVAEDVVARGIASGDRLAMWGASNGGLLAGAAVALRPDLFTAVFAAVPVLDMMHIMRDPFTAEASRSDYGDPADPAMAPVMFAYSPYHNLRDGVAYPATLVAAGENDVRCRPWHSRKFVARLEQANAATTPALLRMWTSTGHGTGRTARSDVAQTAEWLGFLMRHLGMAPEGAL